MSTDLYYNNAFDFEQSVINYSSKEFRVRITATHALKDEGRGHSLTLNVGI